MSRILIAGGPRCGKTTAAIALYRSSSGGTILHTDIYVGAHDWSAASSLVARHLDEPGPWIIEGVAVIRALRKWLASHPTGQPCDRLLWFDQPYTTLTPGQQAMLKGCVTVRLEIMDELRRRGVTTEVQPKRKPVETPEEVMQRWARKRHSHSAGNVTTGSFADRSVSPSEASTRKNER